MKFVFFIILIFLVSSFVFSSSFLSSLFFLFDDKQLNKINSYCGENSKIRNVYVIGNTKSVRCFDYNIGRSKVLIFKDKNDGKIILKD